MLHMWRRFRFLFQLRKSIPFLKDFFTSKEVSNQKKFLSIGMVVGYWLFPFDVIPDFLLFFGIFDDLAVAGFVFQQIVKLAPESMKARHGLMDEA